MKITFRHLAVVLALTSAPVWLDAREPAPAPAPTAGSADESEDPRIFRTILRRPGEGGVHTWRIPGLAATPAGTLIAVFDIRHTSAGDLPGAIDVGAMRSTDDGTTWGPLQSIIDYDATVPGSLGNGVGDPAILVDRQTGTILVAALWSQGARAWAGSGPGLTPEETGQLVITRSSDEGVTWSKPVSITAQVKKPEWRLCFQGPGHGIQTRDGTLVFPAQYKDETNTPHSCFIASTDHGLTWHISPAAAPDGPPTSESSIAECTDGTLLLSMRDESRSGQRLWARWKWSGTFPSGQWSPSWRGVTDPTCMGSLLQAPEGGPLLFSNPNHPKQRINLTIRTSTDHGHTWSDGRLLHPGPAMYSCLTAMRHGNIGILYEGSEPGGLVFARLPLDWVTHR